MQHHSLAALSAVLALVTDVSALAFAQPSASAQSSASAQPSASGALPVLCSALIGASSTPAACQSPTITSSAAAGVTSGPAYCTNFADPHFCGTGIDYCVCSNGDFSVASGDNPCPYTTDPGTELAYTTPTCSSATASATASPTDTPTTSPTGTVPDACASGVQASDDTASCWNDLGLTDYVNSWWETNQGSCAGTVVHPREDGDPETSFANCWYKIVLPAEFPVQCDVLGTGAACKEPSWGWFSGDEAVQQFWVTWFVLTLSEPRRG